MMRRIGIAALALGLCAWGSTPSRDTPAPSSTVTASSGVFAGNVTVGGVTQNPNGSLGAPSHTFTNDLTSGLALVPGSAASQGTTLVHRGNARVVANLSGAALLGYVQGWTQLFSPNGTAAAPPMSFLASQGTGILSPAANQLGFAVNGNQALHVAPDAGNKAVFGFNTDAVASQAVTLRAPTANGSNAVVIQNSAGTVAFTVRDTGYTIINSSVFASGSSPGGLAYGIQNNNAGFYLPATSNVGFATAGVKAGQINATQQWFAIKPLAATHATSTTLTGDDSFATFDNSTAAAQITDTLPAATVGIEYTFVNAGGGATWYKVLAVGTDKIAQAGTLGAAAGNLTSAGIWSTVKLKCITAGTWVVLFSTGAAWTLT